MTKLRKTATPSGGGVHPCRLFEVTVAEKQATIRLNDPVVSLDWCPFRIQNAGGFPSGGVHIGLL